MYGIATYLFPALNVLRLTSSTPTPAASPEVADPFHPEGNLQPFLLRVCIPPAPRSSDRNKYWNAPLASERHVSCHGNYNNTYLSAYHTGAGLNDIILTTNRSIASYAFLNQSSLQFDLGGEQGAGLPIPWSLSLVTTVFYTSFGTAVIDVGYGGTYGTFSLTTGVSDEDPSQDHRFLIFDSSTTNGTAVGTNGFEGWLACEWWHQGRAQLFWSVATDQDDVAVPRNCQEVYIVREDI